MHPIAKVGGEQPQPDQPSVRSGQGGVLGPRPVYIRASVNIEKCGTTPGRQGCDAIFTKSTGKNHQGVLGPRKVYVRASVEIEKYGAIPGPDGTEMQHDE